MDNALGNYLTGMKLMHGYYKVIFYLWVEALKIKKVKRLHFQSKTCDESNHKANKKWLGKVNEFIIDP